MSKESSGTRRERASAICVSRQRLLLIEMQDPGTHQLYLFPPGGEIEEAEAPEQTAIRETREESGYDIEILYAQPHSLSYEFEWNKERFDCLTHFFFGRLVSETAHAVNDAPFVRGAIWLPLEEIPQRLTYHRELCEMVHSLALSFPLN
jgi:8-oxo-dGTP pyrophosphatase MutT (NUDIX family)